MTHEFDRDYWDAHWQAASSADGSIAVHPYLAAETASLVPGTALEAGCGEGAEALWLAAHGWTVTVVDLSSEALARAAVRATDAHCSDRVTWVRADLGSWEPDGAFDLVTTHYAHAAGDQLDLYARLAGWVAPGGTLLVVGHRAHDHEQRDPLGAAPQHDGRRPATEHRHDPAEPAEHHDHDHDHDHGARPTSATVTAQQVRERFERLGWSVVTAAEPARTVEVDGGRRVSLHDVVIRAVRPSTLP